MRFRIPADVKRRDLEIRRSSTRRTWHRFHANRSHLARGRLYPRRSRERRFPRKKKSGKKKSPSIRFQFHLCVSESCTGSDSSSILDVLSSTMEGTSSTCHAVDPSKQDPREVCSFLLPSPGKTKPQNTRKQNETFLILHVTFTLFVEERFSSVAFPKPRSNAWYLSFRLGWNPSPSFYHPRMIMDVKEKGFVSIEISLS